MAAYQASSSANNGTGSTSIVGTKPTGTVDGDLLVASIGIYGDLDISAAASGWTLATSDTTSSTGEPTGYMYYKVASSEPSTWTWTLASSVRATITVIRIDGQASSSPLDISGAALVTGDSTPTYAIGDTQTQPLDIYVFSVIGRGVTGDSFPVIDPSNYAMATDDPTWENEVVQATGDSAHLAMGTVTAVRTPFTATGNFSVTLQGTITDSVGMFAAFKTADQDATGTVALVSSSPSFFADTVEVGTTGTAALHETDTTLFSQSGKATTLTQWINEDDVSTTWTNET